MKPFYHVAFPGFFAGLILLMPALAYLWLHLTSPSDGARLAVAEPFGGVAWTSDGIPVSTLDGTPETLQSGDLIVSVDGISMKTWAEALTRWDVPRPQWQVHDQVTYSVLRDGIQSDWLVQLRPYALDSVLSKAGALPLIVTTFLIGTAYLYWRRPNEPATLPLFLWSLGAASAVITISVGLYTSDFVGGAGFWLFMTATFGAGMGGVICVLNFALVFPQPHPILSRYGRKPWLIAVVPMVLYGIYLVLMRTTTASIIEWIGVWDTSLPMVVLLYLVLTLVALVTGYRSLAAHTLARQQSRLVVFSTLAMALLAITFGALPKVLTGRLFVNRDILALLPLMVLVAIAAAILRYRLFAIDVIVNRALVYSALTALIVALYTVLVGLLSLVLQTSVNFSVSLVATGGVAILIQPLRERLQRGVNRLMYGERDDPYTVLGRLSERLEVVVASQAVLPAIVETVAEALKLPYVAIALREGETTTIAADYYRPTARQSKPDDQLEILPLTYQSETVGQLILAPRARGEVFSPNDRQLLETVARQAGIAAYNVRLTQDLQWSRERLVTTREEERRRLRRDLHDGLGPVLAAMSFKLDAIHNLIETNPNAARGLATGLKTQIQISLEDIRRIAYGLRPPALDELGLVGALHEHIIACNQSSTLQIDLEAPKISLRLPAAVEVAAYRIALEAITNVIRHAHADHCQVTLSVGENFCLEIVDNGRGIADNARVGVGLSSIRERVEELGGTYTVVALPTGGTRVAVRLPLPEDE